MNKGFIRKMLKDGAMAVAVLAGIYYGFFFVVENFIYRNV